ncbi:MAG TPA: DM13 domain-containing protein [Actinomycetota bacterium]
MSVDPPGGRSPGSPPRAASEPRILARGAFRSLEHRTTGSAAVLELESGMRILRFQDLDTSNGPDLHVYLSELPATDDWRAYGVRYLDLGKLKGNIGSQNYALPEGLDLSRFRSAVVWCERFAVGFGVAGLRELVSVGSDS